MFKKQMRHLNRYREIVSTFARHGFGFLIEELGLHHMVPSPSKWMRQEDLPKESKSVGLRLRLAFEELGPTFIKFGQLLSTRPDIFPEHIISELDKLQDRVDPFSYQEVKQTIEEEFDQDIAELFSELDEHPLATASIGQVHLARLKDSGEEVVVKVQRPGITSVIETDLEILSDIIHLAVERFRFVSRYNLLEIVEEFSSSIRKELNYTLEARSAEKFKSMFSESQDIYVPQIYWNYTTRRVITLERIHGITLKSYDELVDKGYDLPKIARKLTESYLHQVLMEGFFHGDPHPGNFLIMEDGKIAFTDFGIVGQLTPDIKDRFASLMIAVLRQDVDSIVKNITKLGFVTDDVNLQSLKRDVIGVRDKYFHLPLKQISFGEAIEDFFDLVYRHKIQIPSDLTLLGKTFLTLEGVVKKLDPNISVVEVAEPFGKKLIKDRFRPSSLWKRFSGNVFEFGELVWELPGEIKELTNTIKRGKVSVEINVPQIDKFMKKIERVSNRLSFSIVLLSFSIIMSGLIIGSSLGGEPIILWQLPAVEIGFVVALFMFVWLIYSIFRSGRF